MLEGIRKFRLRHHDLPTMLENVAGLLRLLTLNIDSRHRKRIPAASYLFTLACVASFVHEFLVSPAWFIFYRPGSDILQKLFNLATATGSCTGVGQFACMYWRREELQNIVSAYLHCDQQVTPTSRMSKSISATLRVVKKRAMLFWILIMSNCLIYIFIPYALPGRHLNNDFYITYGLEPMYESPNFEVSRVVHVFSMMIVVTGPISITTCLIIIVGYTEAQMIALSQELINLWEDAQTDYERSNTDDTVAIKIHKEALVNHYIKRRLEAIIEMHAVNKRLINKVEDVFKNPIALKFLILYITLIVDLLAGLESTYMLIPYAMVLVAMDCFTGQRLLEASSRFEAAVYGSGWERLDARNRRLALLLLRTAQGTMRLSAGGVPSLGYATLLSITKSVYSAYAALRSTMNKV